MSFPIEYNIGAINRKFLSTIGVLGAIGMVSAQQKQSVSGRVVDMQNNSVPYVSVTFEHPTNPLYSDAVLTDEKGHYQITLAPGNYTITIEAIDYKRKVITQNITGAKTLPAFKLEKEASITNAPTKNIEGVVMTVTKKPYKVELDKKTYDVSSDIVSKGGSLQEVLQNVPSLEVDSDGTVSMRGSSNVRFLINGKPSAMLGMGDGANALQSIPADQIDRIEVITNPSSKFEASGTSGILNIILKKNKKSGFNGNVSGAIGYLPQTNLNANLSWRKGNLTWFINGGGGYRESKGTTRTNTNFKDLNRANQLLKASQEGERNSATDFYNATAGMVYDFGKQTSLNVSGSLRSYKGIEDAHTYYTYLYNSRVLPSPYMLRKSSGNSSNLSYQGDLGLDHKFSDRDNLSVSLSYQSSQNNGATEIAQETNNVFDRKFVPDSRLPQMSFLTTLNTQDSEKKTIIGKVDYEINLGEQAKLELGYRLDANNNAYHNVAQERIGSASAFSTLGKFTNDTTYDEVFNAFYVQYKNKIGNLGYQLGLRDEHSKVTIDYKNLEDGKLIDQKQKSYNNLFPSVYLSYDLGKNNKLLLNYSKRIDRPRAFFMVPYFSLTDDQNLFLGNLDLNPSYVHSFELGYSYQKKAVTINPTLYLKHKIDDDKMLVYRPDERTNVFYTNPINLGNDTKYGIDLNANFDLFSWWKVMASVDVFGYKTTGTTTYEVTDKDGAKVSRIANFEGSGFSNRMRLNSTFKVDKTLSFQLQGFYRGRQKTAFQNRKAMYALNFGASKTVLGGDGTITLNVQDLFNTRNMTVQTFSETSNRESYMQWQPRSISLSFSYRFKQGERVEQPKRKRDQSNYSDDDVVVM